MREGYENFANLNLDAQFFHQFAVEAVLVGFGRLALAAGKLPESAEMIVQAALGDEHAAFAENNTSGHFNDARFQVKN